MKCKCISNSDNSKQWTYVAKLTPSCHHRPHNNNRHRYSYSGSVKVSKALMAPSVRSTKGKDLAAPAPQDSAGQAPVPAESQQPEIRRPEAQTPQSMHAMAQAVELKRQLLALRRKVEENCDYVGDKFADKAREIASGESDAIGIYGEATADEAEALRDEGIEFGQIPWVKEDA